MVNCKILLGRSLSARDVAGDASVVVIDNLRASSTIVTALALGVGEIVPVVNDESAFDFKKKKAVIAGESNGVKLAGYDLGNSPTELVERHRQEPFSKMVLKTGNLVPLLCCLRSAYVCSSLNLLAVSKHLENRDVCIIAVGGRHGATEDLGVAFALAAILTKTHFAMDMINHFTLESPAARYLATIGYGKDIEYIARVNVFDVIPFYDGKKIVNHG